MDIKVQITTKPEFPKGMMQVKHDFEANDGLFRIGMPSVLSLYLNRYTELTEDWQWFWFRQMVHSYTNYVHWNEKLLTGIELDTLKGKWRSLTKTEEAFTNFKGTNDYKDYITPNKLSGNPGQEPLVCTGNIYKVLGGRVRLAGDYWIPIETLDGTKPPPPIEKVNALTRRDLIFSAVNTPADKTDPKNWKPVYLGDGRVKEDPFPQLGRKNTPVPLRTNGKEAIALKQNQPNILAGVYTDNGISYAINYIRESRLKPIDSDSPYIP